MFIKKDPRKILEILFDEHDDRSRLLLARREAEFAGKRVLLAGFTDVSGRFPSNMVLGSKRAAMARTAVLTAAGPGLDQRLVAGKGYGSLAPVGCSNTAEGQRLNRRVEVWVANEVQGKSAAR